MTGRGEPAPRPRRPWLPRGLIVLYALALLGIGLGRDWRLVHEDNGAWQTSLALSHLRLGLERTHAHNVLYEPATGLATLYGHHPPGVGLVLAAVFRLSGSTAPAVARLVPIAFHLASLLLVMRLLELVAAPAWLGGLFFATLPMSAFFGRMVNFEAPCLTFCLLAVVGWIGWQKHRRPAALATLAAGIVVGALFDWPAVFFGLAIALVAGIDAMGGDRPARLALATAAAALLLAVGLDLGHLALAGGTSLGGLVAVAARAGAGRPERVTLVRFLLNQAENFRHYFSHSGLIAAALAAAAVLRPGSAPGRWILGGDAPGLRRRALAACGLAALAYLLAAPAWAMQHHYWQWYFLPFVVVALTGLAGSLLGPGWRRPGGHPRLLALVLIEVAITSAATLGYRHLTPRGYAIEQTARLRARYLAPEPSPAPLAPSPPPPVRAR